MSNFTSIDLSALVTVTGGDNTETTKANGNVGVTVKGTQVGVQGGYESSTSKSDPAQCAADVRKAGGSPTDILKCYGK
jgi:hypothetical protein